MQTQAVMCKGSGVALGARGVDGEKARCSRRSILWGRRNSWLGAVLWGLARDRLSRFPRRYGLSHRFSMPCASCLSHISSPSDPLSALGPRRPSDTSLERAHCCLPPTRNFFDEYSLGTEVMPSFHRGMKVLNAIHRNTGTEVVIKVRVKKESFRTWDEEDEWRCSTEFMLGLNSCSNIARLYEVLEDDTAYYVIMEKVSGQDLFESIAGQALPPVDEVKEIISQVLVGLVELHTSGRVHRDLKLENIMLDRTPRPSRASSRKATAHQEEVLSPRSPVSVKLIDFDTVEEWAPETPKRRRDVLGTDQYIAQEARRAARVASERPAHCGESPVAGRWCSRVARVPWKSTRRRLLTPDNLNQRRPEVGECKSGLAGNLPATSVGNVDVLEMLATPRPMFVRSNLMEPRLAMLVDLMPGAGCLLHLLRGRLPPQQ